MHRKTISKYVVIMKSKKERIRYKINVHQNLSITQM